MKFPSPAVFPRLAWPALALGALLLLSGCASTVESRIKKNPEAWQRLDPNHQALALRGQVVEGMTRDGVYFSWGSPSRVVSGSEGNQPIEQWRYIRQRPVYTSRLGFGYGGWGSCHSGWGYYGPEVVYIPEDAGWVDFRNGRVAGWAREY